VSPVKHYSLVRQSTLQQPGGLTLQQDRLRIQRFIAPLGVMYVCRTAPRTLSAPPHYRHTSSFICCMRLPLVG
jgi:hypothetical protein